MSEGSATHGESRSRPALGDVTNRIGKRGFSGIDKDGVMSFNYSDKDAVKRICVSPRPCSEINSLKGNVISSLSKIPNENREPNLYDDGDGHNCLKEKNDVTGNLKAHGGSEKDKISDLNGANVVNMSVNHDNDLGDGCGVTDLGQLWNSLANAANGCSTLDSLKEKKITGNAEVANEKRESNLYDDGDGHNCLKEKNDVTGNLKAHGGREKDKISDLNGANVVNMSVNHSGNIDNDLGDGCGVIDLAELWNSIANAANGCSSLDSLKENKTTGNAEVANENRCSKLDFGVYDAIKSVNAEANSELGDGSRADTSRTVSETGNDHLRDEDTCEENISPEGTQSEFNDRHNDLDDHNADNFVLSQTGSVDCTLLPQSQESRVFGIDKSNGCTQMTVGTNAIKSCSCSFCTKAAYIWLDLHQKDIKARTSALKKSQRDACILAERSCRIKVNEKYGAESASRANKLESHLVHQWKSLFQHMADIWEAESNQLDASLLPLNNLKDRCKAEMELMNAKPSEKN